MRRPALPAHPTAQLSQRKCCPCLHFQFACTQAWLSSIETVPCAGLPMEYWNTPAKYVGYAALLVVAVITAGYFVQQ